MHKLNKRLSKLETVITGKPFFIPIFPPYTLEEVTGMMDSWGINRRRKGTIIPISMSEGTFGEIEYDPDNLELLERELAAKQKELEAAEKDSYDDMLQREADKHQRQRQS